LRDVKLSALVETYDAQMLTLYARGCAWALARAHAKAGDPWLISGYLGKNAEFEKAIGKFSVAYADQAERDHGVLKSAARAGLIDVEMER
jgi:NAD(P)H-dependent flavin oxidoreductase YrpB (nitropropane dioxygenase family)